MTRADAVTGGARFDPVDREGVDRVRFVPAGAWQQFGLVACGAHIDTYPS
jgi:hypothetical protein